MISDLTGKQLNAIDPTAFPAFFHALWGYSPFDWQTRLLARVAADGWPSTLDLPTGAGKTSTLDVAIFALALDAAKPLQARRQARRIVLVVDRRVVVDQAFERAATIAKKLDESKDGVLADVAAALRTLSGNPNGLPVLPAILRGGMPRESEWAKSPSQPVILTSTVDQVGSRLLFRGYGVSDRMRPLHAGLLGCDTLLLLDEVHLARPFEETLSSISRFYSQGQTIALARPLQFVRMSATVAESAKDTFRLTETDRAHGLLKDRLVGKKSAVLRQVSTPRDSVKASEAMAKAALREAERLAKRKARAMAIIVNRVETARKIARLAREAMGEEWTVSLLTGRMRPLDRMDRQAAVLEQVMAGRKRSEESPRLLVVSTQAIEAGADFDFDALVTECASLDALRQRFGRLDRLGLLGSTEAVIVAGSSNVDEKAEPDPIYRNALRETWRFLTRVGTMSGEHDAAVVDFGIDAMDGILAGLDPQTKASLIAPRAVAPILTASHLERWVQTSPAPHADPEVGPFLHGIGRGTAEVQIVWRADIGDENLSAETLPKLQAMLDLVRPSGLEALSIPLWAARQWLNRVFVRTRAGETETSVETSVLADVEGADGQHDIEDERIAPTLAWQGGELRLLTGPGELQPGLTLVVPSVYGGLDPIFACWDPESTTAVADRGDEAQILQSGRAILRWHPAVIQGWAAGMSAEVRGGPKVSEEDFEERGGAAEREAFLEWRTLAQQEDALPLWTRVASDRLAKRPMTERIEMEPLKPLGVHGPWRVQVSKSPVSPQALRRLWGLPQLRHAAMVDESTEAATEGDEGNFLGAAVSLSYHLEGVRDQAERFGSALGLPEAVISDLALAGRIHDLGKADPRFQLLLHGGDPVREAAATELLAKSDLDATDRSARERARARSEYPRGMRHELLSVALAGGSTALRDRAQDWNMVLHLVASHHGWCRPFAPPALDTNPRLVAVDLEGTKLTSTSAHGLERFDSPIPERFWMLTRRYGYWGLAWLESILRLADHRESEREASKEEAHDE